MKLSKFHWVTFALVLAVLLFLSSSISFISDWLLFEHLGYLELLTTPVVAQLILFVGVGVFVFTFLYLNLRYASRADIDWYYTIPENLTGKAIVLDKKVLTKIIVIGSAFIAVLYALFASSLRYEVLAFINATPFETTDPIFGKDLAFYVFALPVYSITNSLVRLILFITLLSSILIYLIKGEIPKLEKLADVTGSLKTIYSKGKSHLSALTLLLFVTFIVDIYLKLHRILLSPGGLIFGATYTDINVQIPFLWSSLFLVIAGAVLTLIYLNTHKYFKWVVVIFVLYLLSGPARFVSAGLAQGLVVDPNELERERQFIENNILATRAAYDLDKIEEQRLSTEQVLEAQDIEENEITIKNVRLWDRSPLLSTFSQIQEIRTYYDFSLITNDRYVIDGELRQIMLSPRELNSDTLPNPSWINQHLVFTHGHGVVAGPVNQVTEEGLPVLFVQDIPSRTDKEELRTDENSIYYGILTNDYVIVNSKNEELDYPSGDDNIYTSYQGEGGVQISSLAYRLLYAFEFGSSKILLSSDITNESRIQYKRNILERVQSLAPFLTFDMDPYLVIADRKLYWMIDAYTLSSLYPYSQPHAFKGRNINYIRNSVKIVVDAYGGFVDFYIAEPDDPLIKTVEKIFPETFKPIEQMPESQKVHIRYPEDIFAVQSETYKVYHMNDPQVFYNREDEWEVGAIGEESGGSGGGLAPRHLVMKLPGEQEEEFILMIPFTPRGKDNMSAWLAARNDGENYGKIIAFTFPKETLVYGPRQIIGRINQQEDISQQISLWDQRGSQVIRGPLLVIPIENSLIYVQPLYLQAEKGSIPELKRVIVAYRNEIEMADTLEEGLAIIFGAATQRQPDEEREQPTPITTPQTNELLNRAQELYSQAMEAQRQGNWSEYGTRINELGDILNQLGN